MREIVRICDGYREACARSRRKVTYFECKICYITIIHDRANQERYEENFDPNAPNSGGYKFCLANQNFTSQCKQKSI